MRTAKLFPVAADVFFRRRRKQEHRSDDRRAYREEFEIFHVLHLLKQKFPEDAASSGNNKPCGIFFHPDFTVGTGITPVPAAHAARGLYRRSGISPCPEDTYSLLSQYSIIISYICKSIIFNILYFYLYTPTDKVFKSFLSSIL